MRLLLDTHVLLWWALGNPLLKPIARTMIEDEADSVSISVASVWEIAIKSRLQRRSPLPVDVAGFVGLVNEAGFDIAPVLLRHAVEVEKLPAAHGDPFDRLLVATAVADTLRLVTHDRALAAYGDHVIVV